MPHIVIVSEEKQLANALSDIISRELGAQVTSMESAKTLSQMPVSDVDLVIATQGLPSGHPFRAMQLKLSEPRKIRSVLTEIALHLTDKGQAPLPLAEGVHLYEKTRRLEHAMTGSALELTEKELALLLFIKSEGEASRDDILKQVWGFADDVTTNTLDTHLYRLRQKWREIADYDCIIATDGGYRWYDAE